MNATALATERIVETADEERSIAERMPTWAWLIAGVVVTAMAGNRYNVAALGWVAWVPWLVYLRLTSGWRKRLVLLGVMQLGVFVNIVPIMTEPLPWFFALMYSVPMALVGWGMLLGFETLRRRLGDAWGLILFPALVIASEWASATFSAMGSWGAAAYTQLDNLALLQTASLFGLGTISGLLAAVSALAAVLLTSPVPARRWRAVALVVGLVIAAHTFGAVRLLSAPTGPQISVATVSTDAPPKIDQAVMAEATEQMFIRSAEAAERGAELIVWNEGSTAIMPGDQDAFLARAQEMARRHQVDLVIGYVVPFDGLNRFENKYVWMTPEGPAETYLKHKPVPSEGSIPGTAPIRVLERPWGKAAGAICYDYDFPALARQHARGGAGLVAVPSSDWRGIDPFHTKMASVRGIEGGYSVVRSVRWATSGAYDAYGRARATASWFEGERIMLARVPVTQVPTLYTALGDALPISAVVLVLVAVGLVFARRFRRRSESCAA